MLDRTGYAAPPSRRSPLAHRAPIAAADGGLALAEIPFKGKLIVRGEADRIGPALESGAGLALPHLPCMSAASGLVVTLWLGPSEWLAMTPQGEESALAAAMRKALAAEHHQITDVTDYYTVISASGPLVRDALAKLTPLDLHPRAFPEGAVKGSVFGRVPAQLHRPAEGGGDVPRFEIVIRWSHADYLWCLLALAGREYGLPAQKPEGGVRLARPRQN